VANPINDFSNWPTLKMTFQIGRKEILTNDFFSFLCALVEKIEYNIRNCFWTICAQSDKSIFEEAKESLRPI
jgi:hypothetical protein